jgi:hypothetical protein
MAFVKDLFWHDDECVVQFHPPKSEYINNHPYCLHLWKPPYEVKLPPSILVGVKEAGELKSARDVYLCSVLVAAAMANGKSET